MAKIKTTKGRRGKVQFYLDAELDALYRANRIQARKLSVGIDYTDDFHRWFRKENEEVQKRLDELAGEKGETKQNAVKTEKGNV